MGFLKGKEEVVADADYSHAFIAGAFDFFLPIIGRGSVYLYFVLSK
jgi:hypothetical protein